MQVMRLRRRYEDQPTAIEPPCTRCITALRGVYTRLSGESAAPMSIATHSADCIDGLVCRAVHGEYARLLVHHPLDERLLCDRFSQDASIILIHTISFLRRRMPTVWSLIKIFKTRSRSPSELQWHRMTSVRLHGWTFNLSRNR